MCRCQVSVEKDIGDADVAWLRARRAPINVTKVVGRVNPGEERSVEPSTTLGNQVRNPIRHVLRNQQKVSR